MRSKEERKDRVKESMQRNKGEDSKYASEKAQKFKDNYTKNVKSAVNQRRIRNDDSRYSSKGSADERAATRQQRRKDDRAAGMSAKEQKSKAQGGYYGAGYQQSKHGYKGQS